MKNMRIPLIIALVVGVVGIIFGSFFDLQISTAIANPKSGLGLTISAIGPTIGFMSIALMGGGFLVFGLRKEYHILLRILFFALAAACFAVSIFYPQGEYFGLNGFYHPELNWLSFIIVIAIQTPTFIGGYFFFKKCENKNMWIVFCVCVALCIITLLFIISGVKDHMHRPRYRLVSTSDVVFHNWWQPFKEYKGMLNELVESSADKAVIKAFKENCKSFPSGHSAESALLIIASTFFPMASEKFKKYQLPAFICGCSLTLIVMFARILAGAHYLSDVSMGASIMVAATLITNEILIRIQPLHIN